MKNVVTLALFFLFGALSAQGFNVGVKASLQNQSTANLAFPNGPIPAQSAFVDWVTVDLRDASDPSIVIETSDGILKDDDTVWGTEFQSPDTIDYYVSINHRNSLGVMTKHPVSSGSDVDFTTDSVFTLTPFLVGGERYFDGQKFSLWGGDANADGKVVFQGEGNDLDAIRSRIIGDSLNIFNSLLFIAKDYTTTDINLDGNVIWAGENNDVNVIIQNTLLNPMNIFGAFTFVLPEQIPN